MVKNVSRKGCIHASCAVVEKMVINSFMNDNYPTIHNINSKIEWIAFRN